jgi:deoxyribonuclease V
MILAFDSYYFDKKAKTVCIAFDNWDAEEGFQVHSEILDNIADYIPGEFYKRELPCILSLLKKLEVKNIEAIVVDGFVFLDDEQKHGLGGYLFTSLNGKVPVIGVAKTNFATLKKLKVPLVRGKSEKPLYITAIGMDLNEAVNQIKKMKGEYRMPTLLKHLDTLTREILS